MSPDKDIFTQLQHNITPACHGSCSRISPDQLVFLFSHSTGQVKPPHHNRVPLQFFIVIAPMHTFALCLNDKAWHAVCTCSMFKMQPVVFFFSPLYTAARVIHKGTLRVLQMQQIGRPATTTSVSIFKSVLACLISREPKRSEITAPCWSPLCSLLRSDDTDRSTIPPSLHTSVTL